MPDCPATAYGEDPQSTLAHEDRGRFGTSLRYADRKRPSILKLGNQISQRGVAASVADPFIRFDLISTVNKSLDPGLAPGASDQSIFRDL